MTGYKVVIADNATARPYVYVVCKELDVAKSIAYGLYDAFKKRGFNKFINVYTFDAELPLVAGMLLIEVGQGLYPCGSL